MEDNRKRNMERRRETSRYAARDRRGKEADIFSDLRDVVPIVEEGTVTHLDRIALLRVAATSCRFRKTAGNVLDSNLEEDKALIWTEDTISECLDGFVIIADSDSTILYITESVTIYLGLTQTDITGRNLKDFLHPNDYDGLIKVCAEIHRPKDEEVDAEGVNIVLRMKTVISPRGRCLNLKSALYKPVSFLIRSKVSSGGHVLFMQGVTIPAGQGSINANASAMTKYTETPSGAFMTRHTCDMKISFVSDRFNFILRSEMKSLMGTSFYDLVHPLDVAIVGKAMKELFEKGHIRTPYYRLIAANNALAWVQTEATTISHTTKGQKGQYVICVHYILGVQGAEESLIVCTDAMPAGMRVDIKKEIEDTRDYIGRQPEIVDCVDFTPLIGPEDPFDSESLRAIVEPAKIASDNGKDSERFDDVIQWLFREQPSSPPPTRYRSADRSTTSSTSKYERSQCDDSPLAASNFLDSTTRTGRSEYPSHSNINSASTSASPSYGRRAQSQGSGRYSQANFSPLAEGLSQCGINSPPGIKSGELQYSRDSRPMVGIFGPTNSPRRFSAVQTSDSLDVSAIGMAASNTTGADMFSTMSATDSNNSGANQNNSIESMRYEPIICDDLQWEEPDLSGLAPFVDTCDMLQMDDSLPPELQSLYDLPDFTPAVPSAPAARPVKVEDARLSPPAKRTMLPSGDMEYGYRNPYQPQYQQEIYWQNHSFEQKPWQPQQQQQQQNQQQHPQNDQNQLQYPSFPVLS